MNILNLCPPLPGLVVSQQMQKLMLRMKGEFIKDDGSGVDYRRLKSSHLFQEYELKARDLHQVDVGSLEEDERKAFFINIYNALTIHGLVRCDTLPGSVLDVEKFWRNTGYVIGGHKYSLDDIEHGILRGNRPHPSSPELFFKESDPRLPYIIKKLDPRIHFALVCGAKSCPPIMVYSGANIEVALDAATKNYLNSELTVNEDNKEILLPKLLQWYGGDFGSDNEEIIRWMLPFLDKPIQEQIVSLLDQKGIMEITIGYKDYNWHLNDVS